MTEESPWNSILLAGLDDWVSLAEAEGYVSDAMPEAENDALRRASIDIIKQMAEENLLELGELVPRFEPWATTCVESIARLRREWVVTDVKTDHGFDWWLRLTKEGEESARILEASDQGQQ